MLHIILMLVGCGAPVPDGYLVVDDALPPASSLDAARSAGAEVFTRMTFTASESAAADTAALTKSRRCLVRYTIAKSGFGGQERWGHVPNSTYDCDDATAGATALANAKTWGRSATSAHYVDDDVLVPAIEATRRTAAARQTLLAEAHFWEVDFDLGKCVGSRTARYAEERRALSASQCSTFDDPGRDTVETRDSLTAAATRARKRLVDSKVRQVRPLATPLPEACQAIASEQALAIPGDTTAVASGAPLAFAAQVFSGETVTIYASSNDFDPLLVMADPTCNRILAVNDDWRGRAARVSWRASEDGDVTVVLRSSGGPPAGSAKLTVEVEGASVLSAQQRTDLEAFAGWAEGITDADVAASWRLSAAPELGTSCLDAALYSDSGAAAALTSASAADDCLAYLDGAVKIQKEVAATQSLAGSFVSGVKGLMK